MQEALFWVLSALALAFGLGVVLNLRNAVAAAMCLVVSMIALAGLFVMLNAEFVGLIQVMVYAGAIVVLFLFVIMLLNMRADTMGAENQPALKLVAVGIGLAVAAKLGAILAASRAPWAEIPADFGGVRAIGLSLYTTYLLPFELTGVLLLAAIVGAVVLAKRRIDS